MCNIYIYKYMLIFLSRMFYFKVTSVYKSRFVASVVGFSSVECAGGE